MRAVFSAVAVALVTSGAMAPMQAATPEELDRLFEALGTENLFDIMRSEGLMQADELRSEMFPGRGGDGWIATASGIYDIDDMREIFRTRFDEELRDEDVAPLLTFFEGAEGREIVSLELGARRALMDPDTEEAAKEIVATMEGARDPRLDLLENFVTVNDLVELNVMGALNASLAFYQGLADGGAFQLGEDQILRDVWAQEPDIRDDSESWLYAFLALAYQPLENGDLEAYIDLSTSEAGQALNRALFAGFDDVFRDVSFDLGAAASRFMVSEEL